MNQVFDVGAWQEVVVATFRDLGSRLADGVPTLIGVLVILVLGWAVSRLAGSGVRRLFRRLGADAAARRLGLAEGLEGAGFQGEASALFGSVVFWVLMLAFVLSAVETLGIEAVQLTRDRLFAWLPQVVGAALIVIAGLLLARLVRNLVRSGAATARIAFADQLGIAAQGVVIVLVGVLTVEHLGVNTELVSSVILALAGSLGFGLALAFALGSRDVVRGLLAGQYLRQTLSVGQEVEAAGRRGRIERIGPIDTLFRDERGAWSVPNARLIDETLVR